MIPQMAAFRQLWGLNIIFFRLLTQKRHIIVRNRVVWRIVRIEIPSGTMAVESWKIPTKSIKTADSVQFHVYWKNPLDESLWNSA